MVDATYIDQGRVQIIKDDDVSFDTARPSLVMFPEANRIVRSGQVINFPSPIMMRNYYYFNSGAGPTSCSLWATLPWQEWGPDEAHHNEVYFSQAPQNSTPGPTTRNLPQEYLGSVPAGTNFLDIRANLTRIDPPAAFMEVEPPIVFFPEGVWFNIGNGGSCTCEYFDPLIRHFDIVLSGSDVYLRRYQSVRNANTDYAVNAGGTNVDIATNQSGWSNSQIGSTEAVSESGPVPKSNSQLASLIQAKLGGNTQKRPSQNDRCSGPFPDLASTYVGDIIITPGRRA
jgi:hypothetical protein